VLGPPPIFCPLQPNVAITVIINMYVIELRLKIILIKHLQSAQLKSLIIGNPSLEKVKLQLNHRQPEVHWS
jgi:hypothetical protein